MYFRSFATVMATLLVALTTLDATAQKSPDSGPVGIFSSRAEYNQFMGTVKQAAYGEGGNPELQAMVPMLNDMVLGQEFGTTAKRYGGAQVGALDLLADSKVREDINMVDEQYEELQKLNSEIQERMAERVKTLDFSDRNGVVEELQRIQKDAREDLESLFIPEQLARLEQIRNQSRLRNQSLVDLLTSNPLRDELDITRDQESELREEEAKIRKEIEEEIAKLRERAKKRLLGKLNDDQRSQVEELFGDTFEFSKSENGKSSKSRWNRGRK